MHLLTNPTHSRTHTHWPQLTFAAGQYSPFDPAYGGGGWQTYLLVSRGTSVNELLPGLPRYSQALVI